MSKSRFFYIAVLSHLMMLPTLASAGNSLLSAAYNTPVSDLQEPAPIVEISAKESNSPTADLSTKVRHAALNNNLMALTSSPVASTISYVLLTNISFAGEQVDLSAEQIANIDNVISRIKHGHDSQLSVLVTAHADDGGDDARNLELSHARAKSVATYLRQQGVVENVIRTHSFGRSAPRNENWTEHGRQFNRRVSITLIQANTAKPPI